MTASALSRPYDQRWLRRQDAPTKCPLDACKTCTGCQHGNHAACRRTVTCPATKERSVCRCCGSATT